MLNLDNLRGIFVAVPIAARPNGSFIEEDYRADIRSLCGSGVHGIYTSGTTGEWYALDEKEFQWMVEVFLEETRPFHTLTQIGCGGLNTSATLNRVRTAVRGPLRPDGVQVLLPCWQPLTNDEITDFFKAVADAADGVPLTHYNTLRAKRLLAEKEYEQILHSVPTLIGSKTLNYLIPEVVRLLRAGLPMNHFIGSEANLVATTIWGSKGVYSDCANYWPKACVELFELCKARKWSDAIQLQERFIAFELEGEAPLEGRGYTDAGWDKGKAEAAGFLRCKRYLRPPHSAMKDEDIEHLRAVGNKYFGSWMK